MSAEHILNRSIVFDYPDRLVGPPAWIGHMPFAFWIVDAHRPDMLVELGTHTGNSYSAFTQAVHRLGLDTQCFAVDTWRGDVHADFYGEEVFEEFSRYHDERYARFSRLVRSTFDEARDHFDAGSIDLLHIDGLHTYEAVKHDFESWLPKMSRRGVVLLHDINVRENQFGVWKLWDELKGRYPHFHFNHSHGLGVVGVGGDLGAPLQWLLRHGGPQDDGRVSHRTRAVFERLGTGLMDRLTLTEAEQRGRTVMQDLRTERDRLIEHADALTLENVARAEQIEALEKALLARDMKPGEIARMAGAIQAKDLTRKRRIFNLVALTTTLKGELKRLRDVVREHDVWRGQRASQENENARQAQAQAQLIATQRAELAAAGRAAAEWRAATAALFEAQCSAARQGAAPGWRRRILRLAEMADGWLRGRRSWVRFLGRRPRLVGLLIALRHPLPTHQSALRRRERKSLAGISSDLWQVFDAAWYLGRYPDAALQGSDALAHYLDHGWREGRDPSPLFDSAYYRALNSDVGGDDPLAHFLRSGTAEGRRFHPLFDVDHYRKAAADTGRLVSGNPLVHYLSAGVAARLSPHPVFDSESYASAVAELSALRLDPLRFYLAVGHHAGPDPHPLFANRWYLERNPDVAAAKLNPLVHYLRAGGAEGRDPNPYFDTAWYIRRNPAAVASGMTPLVHYLRGGVTDGHDPSPDFQGAWYLRQHPDVAASGMHPFVHYVRFGVAEGRAASSRSAPATAVAASAPAAGAGIVQPAAVDNLHRDIGFLKDIIAYHAQRIDHALGVGEGVLDLSDDLRRARETAEFRASFERSEPVVSVCIATYNRSQILIDRCIRSLQAQSYPNLQIVVVGDCCTDDTGHRLAKLRDDRIVFENLSQRGPYPTPGRARWQVAGSNAMNRALDLAEGDFIAHLDDDDEAVFDRIETMLDHARAKRAEFCWHPFWYEAGDGTWTRMGNGEFALGQMTTGSTFYHRYYARIKWDVQAYRVNEPGDWNRLRKIKMLRPTTSYVGRPLMFHYKEMNQGLFVPQFGETFLN